MGNDRKRHDLSNEVWAVLEPYMSEKAGQWKRASKDNRQFINGMFWILRTGASWRDLPPCHGKGGTVYQRFADGVTMDNGKNSLRSRSMSRILNG